MYLPLNFKEVRHKYRQCDCGQLGSFQEAVKILTNTVQ